MLSLVTIGTDPSPPIFIIGCARSGTTLLRMMLDSHPRISCGEETKFLADILAILSSHWSLLETYGLPREWWVAHIRDFYATFQAEVLARRGRVRWAEKTPAYTLHLDAIDELFPGAMYVHVLRDGRDVVASFRDRWGYRAGVRAANSVWGHYVRAARAWATGRGAGRTTEVRYEAMVADPEGTMRGLLEWLGEPWDPALLRYDEAPHGTTGRHATFTAQRRSQGGDDSTVYASRVGAGGSRLDPLLRRLLQRSAGDLLVELGYTG
jgi:hypothetical protein